MKRESITPAMLRLMSPEDRVYYCNEPTTLIVPVPAKLKRYDHHTHLEVSHPKQRERTQELDSGNAREAQGIRRARVCFTLRRIRLLDADAKYGSVKDLLDGWAVAGLIPGDKEGQIRLEVEQRKVGSYAEETTEILIEL